MDINLLVPATGLHPIKRIRDSFLNLSRESGMRRRASTDGFAKWLGRSGSLIRNVENGHAQFSMQLAKLIELKTGVSATWLLSEGAGSSRILAKDGIPWDAAEYLDPYAKGGFLSNMEVFLEKKRDLVPLLVGKMVEARIMMEFYRAGRSELSYDGVAVLRDVLKTIVTKGTEEKQEFRYCMNEVIEMEYLAGPSPTSERTNDLVTGWRFFSMLEDSETSAEESS